MRISIPRERKNGETRVALTPKEVTILSNKGHRVFIETRAGSGSFFTDEEYRQAGATILDTLEEVWQEAELLVKVKEPCPEEYKFFRKNLKIFSFLHPAAFPEMTSKLVEAETQAYSYDLLADTDGRLPILHPMSVIAGTLSVYAGSNALLTHSGGRGVLLSEVCGLAAGKVLVIGAGSAGKAAVETALRFGAETTVFDIDSKRLAEIKSQFPNVNTMISNEVNLKNIAPESDLIVSAVLVPGDAAPKIFSKSLIETLKPGAAFVDIAIDQGGSSETSRTTSIEEPTYVTQRVVHYCVPNIPALAAKTSTLALTAQSYKFVELIAQGADYKSNPQLASALVCDHGELLNQVVKNALN